jgi:hypothetical protein
MNTACEISAQLADLLRRERAALAEFLVALADFDRRRLWVDLDHASLFAFLVKDLGLSNGAAFYRKTAADLVQRFPQIVEPLRDGRLCLTTVVELSKIITNENATEVLPRFFGASKRDAKNVVAEIAPEPAPERTVVTSLITARPAEADADQAELRPANHLRANSGPAPQEGSLIPSRVDSPRTVVEPKNAELSRVHVTVSRKLVEMLEAARAALSHSHPGATDGEILEVGLGLIIQRHAKRRGMVKNPRKKAAESMPPGSAPSPAAEAAPVVQGRYVPAAIRRAIWQRDDGKCQWKLEAGGICGSTCRVELDHIEPFAKGGRILKPEEGRLLCKHHQDVSARQVYGDEVMDRYTRPKAPRAREPVARYGRPPRYGRPRQPARSRLAARSTAQ